MSGRRKGDAGKRTKATRKAATKRRARKPKTATRRPPAEAIDDDEGCEECGGTGDDVAHRIRCEGEGEIRLGVAWEGMFAGSAALIRLEGKLYIEADDEILGPFKSYANEVEIARDHGLLSVSTATAEIHTWSVAMVKALCVSEDDPPHLHRFQLNGAEHVASAEGWILPADRAPSLCPSDAWTRIDKGEGVQDCALLSDELPGFPDGKRGVYAFADNPGWYWVVGELSDEDNVAMPYLSLSRAQQALISGEV